MFQVLGSKKLLFLALTIVGFIAFAISLHVKKKFPTNEYNEYLVKRDMIRPLQRTKGKRPFTEKEMQLLRQFARDKLFLIRRRALSALSYTPDPKQRAEAIQIAIESLNDPWMSVRVYALRLLARQNAKEAVSHILPLLNDPRPEVRQEAKKTLQKLGYQVRE